MKNYTQVYVKNSMEAAATSCKAFGAKITFENIVYLELCVGGNTPGIIKYPFWQMTCKNPNAAYICINLSEACIPTAIQTQSIAIAGCDVKSLNLTVWRTIRPNQPFRWLKPSPLALSVMALFKSW